ncbi:TraR/DksA family transcriptional regulator [Salinivibrio kushneri]|uniref:TraR/DksA family transcriptional regulator n=1 Tax=Salinivibrio kushneri TaxID=1908198 RepID=UPI0022B3C8C9|nr:TraR/DksA C4-type zinc finger protein [Salinivibrio kushneri]WBA10731.1 TraR/DksA C4-type zinc finger protein [Salinivibrio kushneri]
MDLNNFHAQLSALEAELLAELEVGEQNGADSTVTLDQQSVGRLSRMDAMQGQQMALEQKRRRKERLLQVRAAIKRIEDEDYGFCLDCDEPINPKRLEIDPCAQRCVTCEEKQA